MKRWILAAGFIGLATASFASERMLLWKFVQTCVADHRVFGKAFPCLEVNMTADDHDQAGYAVFAAPLETTHIVVTPTIQISGIESPMLIAPNAPNYMRDAWNARHYVEERAGHALAWDEMGLAINALRGRSQDQLHIHVDCVQYAARELLRDSEALMSPGKWMRLKRPIEDTHYWALLLNTDDLSGINVFRLATSGLKIKPEEQSQLSVAVIGATRADGHHGFYVLADFNRYYAHAEYVLDHSCSGP